MDVALHYFRLNVRLYAVMKNKIMVLFAFSSILCSVCLSTLSAQSQAQTIKLVSIAPARSPWDIEQKKLAQEWLRISGGKITMQFLNTNAMGGEGGVIQKMRATRPGTKSPVDGAIFTNIGMYELARSSGMLTFFAPLLFRSQAEVDYVLEQVMPQLQRAVKAEGYELLSCFSIGWVYFTTKELVDTPEKLKKNKMAMGGFSSPEFIAAMKIAGYSVENVSSDKIAQSIKSPGGADGVFSLPMYTYATKYYESLKYILDIPVSPIFMSFIVSKAFWDTVPENLKPQLLAAVRNTQKTFSTMQTQTDAQYIKLMEDAGLRRHKPNAQQMQQWEAGFAQDIQRILPQNTVIDPALYNRISSLLAEYRKSH
ncbi:MAG: TRAP transporter substrate-binding protein DctP [Treponemataceae bacterium]|nr:MAG: TRAP transporter substrate-binding protein DctP [Treponemataceae bacterium]